MKIINSRKFHVALEYLFVSFAYVIPRRYDVVETPKNLYLKKC